MRTMIVVCIEARLLKTFACANFFLTYLYHSLLFKRMLVGSWINVYLQEMTYIHVSGSQTRIWVPHGDETGKHTNKFVSCFHGYLNY